MRWIVLILGLLVTTGCADIAYNNRLRRERIASAFKDWWRHDASSTHSYQGESDDSKAHHEETIVNSLNGLVGNKSY